MDYEDAIVVKNLYFSYNEKLVLKNINLQIKKGEIVTIMGENGAGKTTLIKHFNGLLKPKKGKVIVLGMDTSQTPVSRLARHVGMVFQNPDYQLFAETVEEEIAMALRNFGFPEEKVKARVEWALKVFELDKYRKRSPYLLSIGERKRLSIASVISYDPPIVVLDEPTAGQDFLQKEKIAELLFLLKQMKKTIVMVTHDVEFAIKRSDRIVLMADGEIIAQGPTFEIMSSIELLERARLKPPQIIETAYVLKRKNILPSEISIFTPKDLVEAIAKNVDA